jgi:CBS domain-containing protein
LGLEIGKTARRLIIYLGESDRWQGRPLYAALLEALRTEGVAGATVTRGVAGFGAHSRIHTAAILRLSEDLPLRIEVIDSPDKIDRAIEVIAPMVREGLITVDDVLVIKYTHRYLNPLPSDRPVAEVMTREVVTVNPEMPIALAWERMLEHQLKALPVVTREGRVVGMLTDEDLLSRAGLNQRLSVAERLDAETVAGELAALGESPLSVADVMTQPVITAKVTESLGAAALRMAKYGVKRLPIVDESNRLAGVLSRRDVLNQVMAAETRVRRVEMPRGAARTVQEIMTPEVPLVNIDSRLPEVIAALIENNTHRLIVVSAEGRVAGIISDADVVARVGPGERHGVLKALRRVSPAPASDVAAGDLMSPGVLTAGADISVAEAIKKMLAEGRKWLVVVDSEGRPLGLVDRQILLRAVLHS